MRSFKSKLLSAVACVAPAIAAALPSHGVARPHTEPQLDFQQNYAQATFSVPCTGCLGQVHTDQDDEALVLNFTAHARDEACGASNITINGVSLPQDWNGDYASGSGSYQYSTLQHDQPRDLALAWNSTCLHGVEAEAQVLTVNIKSIDGVPVETSSGFTISFKQSSPPLLLRLQTVPDLAPALSDWRDPPTHLRLASGKSSEEPGVSLEDEIRELRALQAELKVVEQAVKAKKQRINAQLRKQATDEVKHCDSFACVAKTVAGKAQGAWRAVSRLHPESNEMGRPDEFASARLSTQRYGSINLDTPEPATATATATSTASDPTTPHPYDDLPPRPQHQAPFIIALELALALLCSTCLLATLRHHLSSLRTRTERAADWEEAHTARAYKRAARRHAWRNWWRGTSRRDAVRIADYEEKRALIAGQEDVLESAMQDEIRALRVAHTAVNDIIRAEEGWSQTQPPTCTCRVHPASPPSISTYPPSTIPEGPSRPTSPTSTSSLPSYRSRAPSGPPAYTTDSETESDAESGSSYTYAFPLPANGLQYTHNHSNNHSNNYTHTHNNVQPFLPPRPRTIDSGRWTPDSSVVDVSPRPSAETLRCGYAVSESESGSERGMN